eukprot:493328-Ditylum_brightwellii.AAC.1
MYFYNSPWYISSTGAITRNLSEKLYNRTEFVKDAAEMMHVLKTKDNCVAREITDKIARGINTGDAEKKQKEKSWVSMQYGREIVGDNFTSLSDCVRAKRKLNSPTKSKRREKGLEHGGKIGHSVRAG